MIDALFTISEVLHRGTKSEVVRAIRKSDGLRCVVKSIRALTLSVSTAHARAACWREYEMLKLLDDTEGVVKALEHIALADGGAIVLRDSNGSSLAKNVLLISNQVSICGIVL
jgi:serine/threonine protein kinase